jgi:hypothetical protein
MTTLPSAGEAILRELVRHIESGTVVVDDPLTYVGYKTIHDALRLPKLHGTYGDSLTEQGLADLAEWTKRDRHPAITGLVIDMTPANPRYLTPGNGYFELFDRPTNPDYPWWRAEIAKSLEYDWARFLQNDQPPPPNTPNAFDITEPPGRERARVCLSFSPSLGAKRSTPNMTNGPSREFLTWSGCSSILRARGKFLAV